MQFFGISLYQGKYRDFLESIKNPTIKTLVFTPNPEIFVHASRDDIFLGSLKKATYNTPDGIGLYVATLMQGGIGFLRAGFITFFCKKSLQKKYGELIQGSNLMRDLVGYSIRENKKILVIDNYRISEPQNEFEIEKKRIQENIVSIFHKKLPGLQVEVVFDGEKTPSEFAQFIQDNGISYVFSCIGMKKQEERLIQIWDFLPENFPIVGLGVGSSFDYLLGLQKRAPYIFQKMGLEWLYRLILEPRKRWKRIHTAIVEFPRLIKNTSK